MKPSIFVCLFSQLCALVNLLTASVATAVEVRVMISAGFYDAYTELAPAFERSSGHSLIATRGPSLGDSPEAIPTRLKRGEPAEVVIGVGASLDELIRQGLLRAGSKVDLARSEIGMVVRAGAPQPDIGSVDAFRRALLQAKSIAYSDSASGVYLSTVLFARLGVADQVAGKSRKIPGPPSGEPAAAVVARGEAELGFQQLSEMLHVPGVTVVGAIPAELQQNTVYAAGIASAAKEPAAAKALIEYLASPEAAPAIAKTGLTPVSRR